MTNTNLVDVLSEALQRGVETGAIPADDYMVEPIEVDSSDDEPDRATIYGGATIRARNLGRLADYVDDVLRENGFSDYAGNAMDDFIQFEDMES